MSELLCQVLDSLKTKMSEPTFNNWFGASHFEILDENRVVLHVPNKFSRDWILENYYSLIKFEFFRLTGTEHEVTLKVSETAQTSSAPLLIAQNKIQEEKKAIARKALYGLNQRYSFDQFVVGESNQFVVAACKAVANNPAKNYNPLFIYGGVGLGKTHLLNAVGLEVSEKNPNLRIVYVTGEQFTNEVINAIRYDKTYELRKKYRTECDVLLIDDVQFIAGKERTMEEFFHTFNALYDARKQIILTSDTLPREIPHLEERIRSRFSWGLIADIQSPDFETRCAILKKKAEEDSIRLSDDVCNYLAQHVQSNVRDLEGCLIRLSAFASLSHRPITVGLADEVLRNVLGGFRPALSIEGIQQTVSQYFKLQVADLKSPRRHKNLAGPRQIAMYLCKKHVKASYPEIGQKFGGKDHTTVMHAYQKICATQISDDSLKQNLEELEQLLIQ